MYFWPLIANECLHMRCLTNTNVIHHEHHNDSSNYLLKCFYLLYIFKYKIIKKYNNVKYALN